MSRLNRCLRQNSWLLLTSFAAFTGSALVGSLTVDADSSTPEIWLLTMWSMLGFGAIIIVSVLLECVMALMGKEN